jgi:hypothetical protein
MLFSLKEDRREQEETTIQSAFDVPSVRHHRRYRQKKTDALESSIPEANGLIGIACLLFAIFLNLFGNVSLHDCAPDVRD